MMNTGRVILKISFSFLDLVRWSRDVIEMSRLVSFSFELWIMSSNWSIFKFCLALWEVLAMCRIRIKSSWNFCWLTGVLGKVIIKKTAPPGGRKILDVLRRPGAKNFGCLQRQGSKNFERVAIGSEKFWMRHQGGNFVDASPRREGVLDSTDQI